MLIDLGFNNIQDCVNNRDNCYEYLIHKQPINKQGSFHDIYKNYRFYEKI